MKKQKLIAILLLLALVIGLAACGASTTTTPADAAGTAATSADENGTTEPATPAKTSIVIANAAECDVFYPIHTKLTTNMDEVPILHNIYETPLKLMPDGTKEPLLAESYEISADGKDYTLKIRQGVKFTNGNDLTADDVAYSLNTAGATAQGKTLLINFDNAEVIDDYTVVVHLTNPYGAFVNSLASRFALVVDKETAEEIGEDAYNDTPVGTGPYKFVSRVAGDSITLVSNEEYWNGAPAIKDITYKVMTDSMTQMLALENGEVNALLNANISPLVNLEPNTTVKWLTTEASSMAVMAFNVAKGPGADINFRKAIQSALNKEELIFGVYEGQATPIDIYMTSSFSGRPDDGDFITVPFDLAKAKEYLEQSNYNGEEFMLVATSGKRDEVAAQIIQGQLIALGINCTLNALDAASYDALVGQGTGEFGAWYRAGGVSVMDADGLYTYFNSKTLGSRYNMGWFTDELEGLLDAGRVESDIDKRKDIYAQACNIITENAYFIPTYSDLSVVAFGQDMNGVLPRPLTGLYYFNEWS